ncbi:MAG: hypothetical protein KBG07_01180 [Elusimicrobia bacterium]|nr:hypothetical protein [Elusimicrobiota bacterium]
MFLKGRQIDQYLWDEEISARKMVSLALLIECKLSDTDPRHFLRNLSHSLGIPFVQVVRRSGILKVDKNSAVLSAPTFLSALA